MQLGSPNNIQLLFHDDSWKPIYFGIKRSNVKVIKVVKLDRTEMSRFRQIKNAELPELPWLELVSLVTDVDVWNVKMTLSGSEVVLNDEGINGLLRETCYSIQEIWTFLICSGETNKSGTDGQGKSTNPSPANCHDACIRRALSEFNLHVV